MHWLLALLVSTSAFAGDIVTNSIHFHDAPPWLRESRLEKATARIEEFLEWQIRRIHVYRHTTVEKFTKESGLQFSASAFFRPKDGTVHLGPEVKDENFDRIFGHELVHAIFHQKYKGSIPPWLEEGLANYIAKMAKPDYRWLASQPSVPVTSLTHPNRDESGSKYHYQASTAVLEMIAAKCSLRDLLQLSVGAKLTTYLGTYCEIPDVNAAFRAWVAKKAKS